MKLKDLTGQQFGRLNVVCRSENRSGKPAWQCRCDCGATVIARGSDLRSGKHMSCGCLHKHIVTKHGMAKTREYVSWSSMIQRCTNPNATAFSRYGGRGISVCDRWLNSFEHFFFDMGVRPANSCIERIDNDGNYEPCNCRWASMDEQSENRVNNVRPDDSEMIVSKLARKLNKDPSSMLKRYRSGSRTVAELSRQTTTFMDIAGKRFGMSVAVRYVRTVKKRAIWECRCDCGTVFTAVGKDLRQGRTVSCGCKRGRRKK